MKKLTLILLIFVGIISTKVNAQKIYSVDSDYKADIKVYVVDSDYKADLLVYKVDSDYKAKGNEGKWYFVDSDYKAKWKSMDKKHLLY